MKGEYEVRGKTVNIGASGGGDWGLRLYTCTQRILIKWEAGAREELALQNTDRLEGVENYDNQKEFGRIAACSDDDGSHDTLSQPELVRSQKSKSDRG